MGFRDRLDRLFSNQNHQPSLDCPLPDHILKILRPHQIQGVGWLYKLKGNCILADDMGLGKTLQILSWLLAENPQGQVLIVAPPSLLGNWQAEVVKWTPGFTTAVLSRRNLHPKAKILLASYDVMSREIDILEKKKFSYVIFDEAQGLKNANTARSQAARRLVGPKIAMTGTPIENSLKDLYSLMDLVKPGYLGTIQHFRSTYERDPDLLQKKIAPYVLHRKKVDLPELNLPDKKEMVVRCALSNAQRELYAKAIEKLPDSPQGALALIQHLKQLCDDPSLVGHPDVSGKLSWLKSQLLRWNEPTLVFSQYRRMLDLLEKTCERSGWEVHRLDGTMSRQKRDRVLREWKKSTHTKKIFLISLRAGGCGLTLTEAVRVVHYDRWWNPAVEEQATDRSYRIGQENNVEVYKLVSRGTLEEKIDQLLSDKRALQDLLKFKDQKAFAKLVSLTS